MKQANELTEQELALVIAKRIKPPVFYKGEPRNNVWIDNNKVFVRTGLKLYEFQLDWQTIGELWEKYKVRCELWEKVYQMLHTSENIPKSIAIALVEMFYPDGVPQELLK